MYDDFLNSITTRAAQFSEACGTGCSVFDSSDRNFIGEHAPRFCAGCTQRAQGGCLPLHTHLYGCFEAERWDGLYIYYCPIGLVFIATTIYADNRPSYYLVGGPVVMGSVADLFLEDGSGLAEQLRTLPNAAPARVTSIAQTQWAVSMFLSGRDAEHADASGKTHSQINNTLYDITAQIQDTGAYQYPMDIERRLQQMIQRGDKEGSRELINQLLGHLYFNLNGDFDTIKSHAAELIVLFSRAAIEGGADAKQIFGLNKNILSEIGAFQNIDDLSLYLTAAFHRFVGYVFDFEQVKHTDVIHKAVDYIRQNYARRITLDDVAAHVYLSKSYLSKVFNDEMKCSLTSYINTIRVEKSRELLLDDTVSLADISNLVGFDDQSYFTKVFRKTVGVSPGRFRKSRGKLPLATA